MDKEELADLLDEVAQADEKDKIRKHLFNQPNLLTISSVNKIEEAENYTPYSQTAFSSFQVNLPRPALDVKGLQLLSTNIPQCNANIPNTACAFWYYRLSRYTGMTPSISNLYYVRLLPSFYKQENIYQPSLYGYNQTFNNYSAVNTQLIKACKNDLAYDNEVFRINGITEFGYVEPFIPAIPYLPEDITINYDANINKFKMTGQNTEVAYIRWSDATLYAVGDIVIVENQSGVDQAYKCLVPNINLDPNYINVPAWVSGRYYIVNNIVVDVGIYYICIENDGPSITPPAGNPAKWSVLPVIPEWVSLGEYEAGNIVLYLGTQYYALDDVISDVPPATDTANWSAFTGLAWKQMNIDIIEEWDADAYYSVGIIVSFDGILYRANAENHNVNPVGAAEWDDGVNYANWYTYLITGYEDPNVKIAQGELTPLLWNATTLYKLGDTISYNGQVFISNFANVNNLPVVAPVWSSLTTYQKGAYAYLNATRKAYVSLQNNNLNKNPNTNPAFWTSVGWVDAWDFPSFPANIPRKGGLFGLTQIFDMVEISANNDLYTNFPYGVGGQPFNPDPKRLLNSILGFTWNGNFNPTDFGNLGQSTIEVLTSKKFPQLYNRLRPIPEYVVSLGLGATNDVSTSTISLTFTADSYANLVYSSIINIYANIVGASSVDTQSNASLLAITTMNCGNLGVAFWDNYIDNPLTKVNGDIYAVDINFTDEYGEPYYLSNNAVATLVFKVIYSAIN
jgi:hypothetical protein